MFQPAGIFGGTRFLLFPQSPLSGRPRPPETVTISTPPGRVGPGPEDDRVYMINPPGKRHPYGVREDASGREILDLPPWRGDILRGVSPGPDGHFDHIPPGTPEFAEAHVFGATRFTMDVWERYFGYPLTWHFARDFPRLEALVLPSFDNAHVGYGFMEIGGHHHDDGTAESYALNFDVISHEFGHLIIYGTLGVPSRLSEAGEYFGFHESAADMVSILAALNFETMVVDLLDETSGNLYSYNELNRFAELSATDQVRLASHSEKMWQFADGWDDEHDLSRPLTGALFDTLVDVFQEILVERGLIGRDLADLSDQLEQHPEYDRIIQPRFDAAYRTRRQGFRQALVDTRDYMGVALAETWKRLSADDLDYADVGDTLMAVDRALTGGRHRREIASSFRWRGIGLVRAGPRLAPPDESSHAFSSRTVTPDTVAPAPDRRGALAPLA
ncbi:MAG TPA: hypothetical protein VMM55_02250 [Thermohalobaculum sp.]|nr:hypothetical protein [Thermohalobaculum sp.]